MLQKSLIDVTRTDSGKKPGRAILAGLLGSLLLLLGIISFPALRGQGTGQTQNPPQTASQTQSVPQNPNQPANPQSPAPQLKPPAIQLSILLLMDVSGSMVDNNKIEQAKAAAIKAVSGALKATTPPPPTNPQQKPGDTTPTVIIPQAPGIPIEIAKAFDKNLKLLEELQQALGPDIRTWAKTAEAANMGKVIQDCNKLMKGLAFDQQSQLMERLSPLVEKMHYSIAAEVNERLGGGLKYVLPGKTPANPEFGGLYTLKPSDHDAIYLGAAEKADQAIELHKEIAKRYGDDFLKTTESCLESSRYTLEPVSSGAVPETFEKFSGPTSNLDWMRTKSGSKWVQEYVDKAGTVVDLDNLTDATNIKGAQRQLSSYSQAELQNLGVSMDRSSLQSMGYNLGLQSDFERQLALNQARKGLEKGLAAATTEDTAMLMAKYGPRYEEVLKGAGVSVDGTPWKGYIDQITEVGEKAMHGTALDAADKAVVAKFDNFGQYVRESSLANQMNKFAPIEKAWSEAFQLGDKAGANALQSQMTDLLDDTQGALHNFQQLHGEDAVKKMIGQVAQGQDKMATLLTERMKKPWVGGEPSITTCAQTELAAQGKLPPPGTTVGPKLVISDAKTYWEYAKANPGHTMAKVAQYGAYIYVGYEFNSLLKQGKYDEAVSMAKQFGSIEAANYIGTKLLTPKFGPWGGPAVTLAATVGLAIGDGVASWLQNSKVDDMTLSMMTGLKSDGSREYQDKGMLECLSSARITNFQNPSTGQKDRWIDFDKPSEANNMTDDQIMSMIKPGTFGDTTIAVDANGRVTYTKDKGVKMVDGPVGPELVPDIEVRSFDKNQVISQQRLAQMYQAMKEKYNGDLAGGKIGQDSGQVPGDFRYTDPRSNIPGAEFDVPNPGGMSMHEFTYYKMLFDRSWSKWALDKNPQWMDSAYWNSTMENAYKAKWSMFQTFMASMGESKIKDRQFQEKLDKDSPEDLAALKKLAEQGFPFWANGKKLTADDIQKRIDKKLEDRQKLLDQIKNGILHVKLPDDLEKALNELSNMTGGSVEIGIMPYSGSCGDTFSLFAFSQNSNDLTSAINSLGAGGSTPMSPALYQARHALLAYGHGRSGLIILLCDGQNDCSENPVKAADNIHQSVFPGNPGGVARLLRELGRFQLVPSLYAQGQALPGFTPIDMTKPIPPERQKLPITVSTVGFQVSANEQKVLDEVAKAGGGISGSAQNIDQLTSAFTSAIQTATQNLGGFGGGGGGPVLPAEGLSPAVIAALVILGAAFILVLAIVIVRRRGASPAEPVVRGTGSRIQAGLDVAYADGGIKPFRITSARTTIGRGPDNLLVLRDTQISTHHAEILASPDGFLLRDLESANGTTVNGQPVTEAYLKIGDDIGIGTSHLTFTD